MTGGGGLSRRIGSALRTVVRIVRKAAAAAARGAVSEACRAWPLRWEIAAFAAALLIYAVTRLWRLSDYPIYFFTDEAFQPLEAEKLLENGLRDARGRLFPLYFQNGSAWAPVLPVWAHVVSSLLFGKSIEVARGTAAVFTLLGAAAVGLTLKLSFRSPLWWAGPLFLAATPSFFLHSRTTFETVFMAAFYACFLLFYLLYRCSSPWFLYPAVFFGACAFYSYSVGQIVAAVAATLLLVVDIPYHIRQWRHVLPGLLLLVVVALPLYWFWRAQPQAAPGQLTRVSSYLLGDQSHFELPGRDARLLLRALGLRS